MERGHTDTMSFNSYLFLLVFLPLCLVIYFTLNRISQDQWAKIWLLGMSLWFYGYFHILYLLLLLFSICFNYILYRYFLKEDAPHRSRNWMFFGISCNLLLLFVFKYYDFFAENVNVLFHTSIPLLHILLPLGISFFTFQQISFLADAWQGAAGNYSFLDYALYVSFFPQLVAGPIVTHNKLIPQFQDPSKKRWNPDYFSRGCYCFTLGLSKKVLLADIFAKGVQHGFDNVATINSTTALLSILAYTFEIYFDFSGYSDMARGLGMMFNFELPINFDSPYKEVHIVGFWKKWHITLTRFFTRYVYIPLGGNQKGTLRTYVNYLIIFFLSGLWHGANWTFVIWGLLHGIAFVVVRFILNHHRTSSLSGTVLIHLRNAGLWLINFTFICIAFTFFRADSLTQAIQMLQAAGAMQFADGIPKAFTTAFQLPEFWYVLKVLHLTSFSFSNNILCIAYFLAAFFLILFCKNVGERARQFKPTVFNAVVCAFLLLWCVVSFSEVTTFIYYNF